jgi:hypothetical protein
MLLAFRCVTVAWQHHAARANGRALTLLRATVAGPPSFHALRDEPCVSLVKRSFKYTMCTFRNVTQTPLRANGDEKGPGILLG